MPLRVAFGTKSRKSALSGCVRESGCAFRLCPGIGVPLRVAFGNRGAPSGCVRESGCPFGLRPGTGVPFPVASGNRGAPSVGGCGGAPWRLCAHSQPITPNPKTRRLRLALSPRLAPHQRGEMPASSGVRRRPHGMGVAARGDARPFVNPPMGARPDGGHRRRGRDRPRREGRPQTEGARSGECAGRGNLRPFRLWVPPRLVLTSQRNPCLPLLGRSRSRG